MTRSEIKNGNRADTIAIIAGFLAAIQTAAMGQMPAEWLIAALIPLVLTAPILVLALPAVTRAKALMVPKS